MWQRGGGRLLRMAVYRRRQPPTAHTPTDDELLVALDDVHHPLLGFHKIVALVKEAKPGWALDDVRVHAALGVIRGDGAAARAAVAKSRRSLDEESSPIQSAAVKEAVELARARKGQDEGAANSTAADAAVQEAEHARNARVERQALHKAAHQVRLAAESRSFSSCCAHAAPLMRSALCNHRANRPAPSS